jgi:hypothetical protein
MRLSGAAREVRRSTPTRRPALRAVQYALNSDGITFHAIDDDVRSSRNHKFAGFNDSSGSADQGVLLKASDGQCDPFSHRLGGERIPLCDILDLLFKVAFSRT